MGEVAAPLTIRFGAGKQHRSASSGADNAVKKFTLVNLALLLDTDG